MLYPLAPGQELDRKDRIVVSPAAMAGNLVFLDIARDMPVPVGQNQISGVDYANPTKFGTVATSNRPEGQIYTYNGTIYHKPRYYNSSWEPMRKTAALPNDYTITVQFRYWNSGSSESYLFYNCVWMTSGVTFLVTTIGGNKIALYHGYNSTWSTFYPNYSITDGSEYRAVITYSNYTQYATIRITNLTTCATSEFSSYLAPWDSNTTGAITISGHDGPSETHISFLRVDRRFVGSAQERQALLDNPLWGIWVDTAAADYAEWSPPYPSVFARRQSQLLGGGLQ